MSLGISAGAWLVAGATVGGALIASDSSSDAVDAQTDAAREGNATTLQAQREALAYQEKQAAQARADNEPWRLAGVGALNKLAAAPDFTGSDLQSEPGYQFGLSEGMKGLTNSAAARGGLLSGAALKASTRYAQDYASTKFDAAFGRDAINKNRLASLAGVGQTAASANASSANALGAAGANGMIGAGQTIAQNQLGVGNARASGYIANGNALTGAINQGVSAWNQYNKPQGYGQFTEGATNQTGNFDYYGPGYSP